MSSIATIQKCLDVGINHLDTAHVYGPNGESENLIRLAIGSRRDELVVATKCGIHYENGVMVTDNHFERLRWECDESLRRLGTDHVDLYQLHNPRLDAIRDDALWTELEKVQQEGLVRAGGRLDHDAEAARLAVADEPAALEDVEADVGVADVHREQHHSLLAIITPSRTGRSTLSTRGSAVTSRFSSSSWLRV